MLSNSAMLAWYYIRLFKESQKFYHGLHVLIVTTGGLLLFCPNCSFTFFVSIDGFSSNIGLWPNSLTIYSADLYFCDWLLHQLHIVVLLSHRLPSVWKFFNIARIWISFITFLNSFSSASGLFFFSFNLVLLQKLNFCLISISSTFKALETVNLKSLLSIGFLSLSLLFQLVYYLFL